MILKNKCILLSILLALSFSICGCGKNDERSDELFTEDTDELISEKNEQIEKGYNLPVDAGQKEEAENNCKKMMELIYDIYVRADKGDASNVVLSDETVLAMQDKLKQTKSTVTTTVAYSHMANFESVDNFLRECMEGVNGSAVVYEVHSGGGIGRMKFIFDGTNMYVLSTTAIWDKENEPRISSVSYTRIKEWKYTDKGWFCYELYVPEYPEVTEMVDGSCMIRVKPMTDENRKMSEKCVFGLAYQGNNVLCSNWDIKHMEVLDYNGLYEYLYAMKYQEKYNPADYPNGIPKDQFENLIMEYFPVTAEQIREYAVFNEEKQTYEWVWLYVPTYFGTSLPEVTNIKENDDGTTTLTVDAVCEMVLCDDAVITHELTIQFAKDGSFRYLGNEILNNGIENIPNYQYRIYSEDVLNN